MARLITLSDRAVVAALGSSALLWAACSLGVPETDDLSTEEQGPSAAGGAVPAAQRAPEGDGGDDAPSLAGLEVAGRHGAALAEPANLGGDLDGVPWFNYLDGALSVCQQGSFVAVQGDLHTHTNNSDGHYEPSTAFQVAHNCGMQFLAVTDHSEGTDSLNATEMAECLASANAATVPNTFVALCGFEVEPDRGHANVYFTNDEWGASSRTDFAQKLNNYPGQAVVAQINHPCTSVTDNQWGPYPCPFCSWENPPDVPFPYDGAIDDNMALMEFSGGGTFPCKQEEYHYLLDTGWHVAPSSNSDRHGEQQDWCAEPQHRTGLWVTALTPTGLRDALRQRRSFAAPHGSSIRLLADGCWMGSVVGGVSTATLFVEASHGGGLGSIELIGNGGATLHSHGCGGATYCAASVDLAVGAGSYVYAYAPRLDNGNEPLVAAPVWFRSAPTCTGPCTPGQVATQACGNCGSQSRRCLGNCTWGPWGACVGSGPCAPGQVETAACNACGSQTRSCEGSCTWGAWSPCQGSGAVETVPCGNCGHQTVECALDGTAVVQTPCLGSGPCAPGQVESEACCDCGTSERVCQPDCQWPGWSACAGPDPGGGTEACSTGIGGLCDPGLVRCVDGCLHCAPVNATGAEICDGLDNDCNGAFDEGDPTVMGAPPPPHAARLEDASFPSTMAPGQVAQAWVTFENVGAEPWRRGELWLTTDDASQASALRHEPSWPAYDVAAVVDQDVMPGQAVSLAFFIALEASQQEPVTETFRLATSDGTRLACPAAHVTTTIRPRLPVEPAEGASPHAENPDVGSCGCRLPGRSAPTSGAPWLALLAASVLACRRRPRRR